MAALSTRRAGAVRTWVLFIYAAGVLLAIGVLVAEMRGRSELGPTVEREDDEHPWLLLSRDEGADVVPCIGDEATVVWGLGKKLGDTLPYTDERGRERYLLLTNPANTEKVKAWLRGLADGYVLFDNEDMFCKVQGPAVVIDLGETPDQSVRRAALALHGPQS